MTSKVDAKIFNPYVTYQDDWFEARYGYDRTYVQLQSDGFSYKAQPVRVNMRLRTSTVIPRTGVMLVGWGGNNGSTLTAALLANRLGLSWPTKDGIKKANFYGSLTQASTTCLGSDRFGDDIYVPLKDLLPLLSPDDIILDGWDISSLNLAAAMERARVLDPNLQSQLRPHMEKMKPRASIFSGDFIASNQADRADNVLKGEKNELLNHIRSDIRSFKGTHSLDKVIIVWTANTERFCEVAVGLNDTADNLLESIELDRDEVSPSTMFAVASILEGCAYINGSPQNTFVPGVIELAEKHNVFIGGDDFKSGQTKVKSVLVDFLVGAGIKPTSIVSYNHLGNNDGKNLSAPEQFRSKEISKRNVVDDMVESNRILYAEGEKPDHCVVIKYVPYVGDSKRAMDEYTSEIMLGGHNTIVIHNTCEDSLLATPIILDLVILTEICQRITFKVEQEKEYQGFHSVLSILSYLCKAPLVRSGAPIVNALFKQRACIENVFRACIGLPPLNHMALEHKLKTEFDSMSVYDDEIADCTISNGQDTCNLPLESYTVGDSAMCRAVFVKPEDGIHEDYGPPRVCFGNGRQLVQNEYTPR